MQFVFFCVKKYFYSPVISSSSSSESSSSGSSKATGKIKAAHFKSFNLVGGFNLFFRKKEQKKTICFNCSFNSFKSFIHSLKKNFKKFLFSPVVIESCCMNAK